MEAAETSEYEVSDRSHMPLCCCTFIYKIVKIKKADFFFLYLFFNTAKEVTMATNLQQHGLNGQKKGKPDWSLE